LVKNKFIHYKHGAGVKHHACDIIVLLLKVCQKKQEIGREHMQDVRAWLIAVLAAERITTTVIRGGHLTAAHDVQRE